MASRKSRSKKSFDVNKLPRIPVPKPTIRHGDRRRAEKHKVDLRKAEE